MNFKYAMSLFSAVAIMAFSVLSVSAADNEFWADPDKLTTNTEAPTISFDMPNYDKYVKCTNDASLIELNLSQEKDNTYQGGALKLSASLNKDLDNYCTYSGQIRDENGKQLYAGADEDDAPYITMGIKINAGDVGVNYFDGCMITFKYRFGEAANGKLLNNCVFAFPTDNKNSKLVNKALMLEYNDTDNNNVDYFKEGVVTVPEGINATQFVIEIPIVKQMETADVFYIDNITITTPLKSGDEYQQIANLDGYNANAKKAEAETGFDIKEKEITYSAAESLPEESNKVSGKFIGLVVGGVVILGGAVAFVIVKHKTRFY